MKQVLQQIGDSEKLHLALRGEQGIGYWLCVDRRGIAPCFQRRRGTAIQLPGFKTAVVEKRARGIIQKCREHEHTHRGTIVHLEGFLPEIAVQLSKDRIKEYLGQQFASDLRTNMYAMSISDNHIFEPIHPQRFAV